MFAGAAFFSLALTAHAGGITLNDANCDSFSLSGPAGNQVLTCVVSNAPTGCQIQGPGTGTNGVAITLTAICATGSPSIYAWSGGNCAGNTTQSCQAVGTNITQNYSVVISNGIGPGAPNPATKQVVWSNALPVAPSNCSITPSPASLPAGGGGVNLTAQCAGGDPVDTWNWSNATYTTMTGNTAIATISSNTTFKVTPTNAGGTTNAQVTVNVGGGGGGAISCVGFSNTNVITMNWGSWSTTSSAEMGPLDAAVLKFTTGPTTSTALGKYISTTGSGQLSAHDVTLSVTPCDFGPGMAQVTNTTTQKINFTIGGTSAAVLQPSSTYYFNIKNSDGAVCLSGGASCSLGAMGLYKPPGL